MTTIPTPHDLMGEAYELRALLHGAALLARVAVDEQEKSRATVCAALEMLLADLAKRADALGHNLDLMDLQARPADAA